MADRSITIRLGANVTGLVSGFKTAQQSVRDFGSQTQKFVENNRQSLEQVGQAGMIAGGVLAAGFGLAVSKFASFDKAMSSVQAATHATEGDMNALRDAAVKAGADTAFSAEEAASAIEEMAKAGVSTADILGGGLDGALALAAAGAMDVGEAAELAATALTQFGLSGQDIPHIADLLAAGAGKAQGSVQDMGMALKQAGLVANQTGLTIEETTGGLAAFASAGLVGSDAGTSFKSMLQRLTPQSQEAATRMAELGISAYDAQGNFIGLSEFAGNLKDSMKDLTVEERNAAMATIFGSDAVRAASVMYQEGAKGVQEWEDAVNDAGYAAETAALMNDNLAGDLEKLGGAFDTVFLQAGSGANDALRGLVQTTEDFVDAIGRVPAPVLSAIGMTAGLTGGALLLGGAFLSVVPRIADTVAAIGDLRASAPKATNVLGKVGKAAGLAAAALVGLQVASSVANNMGPATRGMEEMAQALLDISTNGKEATDILSGDLFASSNKFLGGEEIANVGDLIRSVTEIDFGETVNDWVHSLTGWDSQINVNRDTLANLDAAVTAFATGGDMEQAATSFRDIAYAAEETGVSLETTATQFPEYMNHLRGLAREAKVSLTDQELLNWALGEMPPKLEAAAAAAGPAASGLTNVGIAASGATPITEEMAEALEDLGISADGAITILGNFAEALVAAGLSTLSARDAERSYEAAIDSLTDSLAENGTTMDINTEQGRNNQAALDAVASAGLNTVTAMASATDAYGRNIFTQDQLQGRLRRTYDDLINSANGMGITGAEADALARSVLGIPDDANIDTWMSDYARAKADETMGRVKALDGQTANVYINTHDTTYKTTIHSSKQEAISKQGTTRGPDAFASGGYTGAGGRFEPAGIVHRGEYVLDQDDVRALGGPGRLDRWRSQLKAGGAGYSMGGQVQARQVTASSVAAVSGGGDRHIHIDAAPGVAYQYAKEVAVHVEQRERNAQAAYGI